MNEAAKEFEINGHGMPTPTKVDLPYAAPGEASIEELAKTMPEEEFRALVIMVWRQNAEILSFVRDVKDSLAGASQNGGMMGKMLAGMMPESMKGLTLPPDFTMPPPNRAQRRAGK